MVRHRWRRDRLGHCNLGFRKAFTPGFIICRRWRQDQRSDFPAHFSIISEAAGLGGGGWVRIFDEKPVFAGFFCWMDGEAGRLWLRDGGEDAENFGV